VQLYDITCSNCGKTAKVTFKPEPGRAVYCKSCLKKVQLHNEARAPERNDNDRYDRRERDRDDYERSPRQGEPRRVSLDSLNDAGLVRFSGQRKDAMRPKQKKEVQVDELKKVLEEALEDDSGEDGET